MRCCATRWLFFGSQHDLDDDRQQAFARFCSATPVGHHAFKATVQASIAPIDSEYAKAVRWHTDVTPMPDYSRDLRCCARRRAALAYGGSTPRPSTAAGLRLCCRIRSSASPRTCGHLHSNRLRLSAWASPTVLAPMTDYPARAARGFVRETRLRAPNIPLVRVHPETGERTLLAGDFVRALLGMDGLRVITPWWTCCSVGSPCPRTPFAGTGLPGDVAMWDNRATQHRAVDDYDDQRRVSAPGDLGRDAASRGDLRKKKKAGKPRPGRAQRPSRPARALPRGRNVTTSPSMTTAETQAVDLGPVHHAKARTANAGLAGGRVRPPVRPRRSADRHRQRAQHGMEVPMFDHVPAGHARDPHRRPGLPVRRRRTTT